MLGCDFTTLRKESTMCRPILQLYPNIFLCMLCSAVLISAMPSLVDAEGEGPCDYCRLQWVGQTSNYGLECDHGGEHDDDCPPDWEDDLEANCCEFAQGGCTGAQGECSCFTCGLGTGCENAQEYLEAWCGMSGTGCCPIGTYKEPPKTEVYRYRGTTLAEGVQACAPDAGFVDWKDCSGYLTYNFSCRAPQGACVFTQNWVYFRGKLKRGCKSLHCDPDD